MAEDLSIAETIDRALKTLEEAGPAKLNETIMPGRPVPGSKEALHQMEVIMPLVDALSSHEGKFEQERLLGEGGMGLVQLATQVSLSRQVAIKSLKPNVEHKGAFVRTLQEAWITGMLEHPNIVPVHDVGADPAGRPQIVLKRIEGQEWGALMHDAEVVKAKFGVDDLLAWNLGILMQVCQALRLAHSRGIVHRDVKPENVMIGEFGEVYLVDWGLAVSLRPEHTGRLPLARDAVDLAGTPAYMAPEMLGGKVSRISERTDVYLLGGCLFEILTQRPPHQADTMRKMLTNILVSSVELVDETSAELRRIVQRATDPDPDARFEDVEQLRLALQGFLQHRGSRLLCERVDASRLRLESALAEAEHEAIQPLFVECRFGYRAALDAWPGNEAAADALVQVTTAMATYELDREDPHAAQKLLSDLDDPPPDLLQRTEEMLIAQEERAIRLARLEAESSREVGMRTRALATAVLGVFWVAPPLIAYVGGFDVTIARINVIFTTTLFIGLLLTAWVQQPFRRTRVNRGLGLGVLMISAAALAVTQIAASESWSVGATLQVLILTWCVGITNSSITLQRWLWLPTAGYWAALAIAHYAPEHAIGAVAGANGLFIIVVLKLSRAGYWVTELLAPKS